MRHALAPRKLLPHEIPQASRKHRERLQICAHIAAPLAYCRSHACIASPTAARRRSTPVCLPRATRGVRFMRTPLKQFPLKIPPGCGIFTVIPPCSGAKQLYGLLLLRETCSMRAGRKHLGNCSETILAWL